MTKEEAEDGGVDAEGDCCDWMNAAKAGFERTRDSNGVAAGGKEVTDVGVINGVADGCVFGGIVSERPLVGDVSDASSLIGVDSFFSSPSPPVKSPAVVAACCCI